MYKNRNMRGGHSTSHSAEFYGGDSGSYYTNPPVAGGSAYGQIRPVSFGTIVGGETGPNLAVYPNGSPIQTGGQACKYRGGSSQSGGNGCTNGHTSPKPNTQSGGHCGCEKKKPRRRTGRGRSRKQKGGTHCSGSHSKPRSRTRTRGRSSSRGRSRSRSRGRARRASQYKRHHTA